ncbi:MAG: aspartyl protease family protein [Defluviitaleaceae bacterium]|nr:aspartyl protease family protein [Defluviitaleaceae bacterium]MCL2264234.1 aspartyl protease family protein [Defluviitaleaceae bacterium]
MSEVLTFDSSMTLEYMEDGHRHLMVPVFFSGNSYANDKVDFILDTGAFLTVITTETAKIFGFDKLPPLKKNIPLMGFAGFGINGDLVEISMLLGNRRLDGVKVAIPYANTTDNILSLNILEHFNYAVDSTNDKIYFSENPTYKAHQELKCGNIFAIQRTHATLSSS